MPNRKALQAASILALVLTFLFTAETHAQDIAAGYEMTSVLGTRGSGGITIPRGLSVAAGTGLVMGEFTWNSVRIPSEPHVSIFGFLAGVRHRWTGGRWLPWVSIQAGIERLAVPDDPLVHTIVQPGAGVDLPLAHRLFMRFSTSYRYGQALDSVPRHDWRIGAAIGVTLR